MVVYIALFLITLILGIALTEKNPTKPKKIIYLVISFALMFVVSFFRYGVGNDYFSYIRLFDQIRYAEWSEIFSLGIEPAFAVLTKAITSVVSHHVILHGIFAILIFIPAAAAIYRYSDKVWVSVSVYLCLTFFYTSMSFIRQSLAASILLLAYGFIKERNVDYSLLRGENKSVIRFIKEAKIIPVMIFAVIAVMFHYTAAVFIPLYLLSLIKPTKKYIIIFSSVSVGTLITCLIMKAAGANPLNLVAKAVTVITGRNYESYIDSTWFETGFGVQYLIMPLALLTLVMISYFIGWREKKEADPLLHFTLMNASIWSFITYAFIVERFSMFIFIYSVLTVPSVLNYFEEKAEEAAQKAAVPDKKMPGYSKAKSEEKKDSSFILTTVTIVGMFIYNCWSVAMNFHGIYPYITLSPSLTDAMDGYDSIQENLDAMHTNADLYTYLIQLKNADCGYIIVSTTDDFDGLTAPVRDAAEYAEIELCRASDIQAKAPYYVAYNDRKGNIFTQSAAAGTIEYSADNGITVVNNAGTGILSINGNVSYVKDYRGTEIPVYDEKLTFILFDESGTIFDMTAFDISQIKRSAIKFDLG